MVGSEQVGEVLGRALAPLTQRVAEARHSRMFHPVGRVLRAEVIPMVAQVPERSVTDARSLDLVAARIAGPALVRLSSAWWKRREWIDVLGCAVRLRSSPELTAEASPGDQDLLFATVRFPITTLLAPLTTEQHDFLGNHYYGVSPFEVEPVGRVKLRIAPTRHPAQRGSRDELLTRALAERSAAFTFEVKTRFSGWRPLAEIRLLEEVDVDQQALRFEPFRDGRGFEPRGFVHALRKGAYAGSRRGRDRVH